MDPNKKTKETPQDKCPADDPINDRANNRVNHLSRRTFLKGAATTALAGSAAGIAGCKPTGLLGSTEAFALEFQEYFKKHYKLMTPEEQLVTVRRLERLAKLRDKAEIGRAHV